MEAVRGRFYLALVGGRPTIIKVIEVNTLKRDTTTVSWRGKMQTVVKRTDDGFVLYVDMDGNTGKVHESAIMRRVSPREITPIIKPAITREVER